MREGHIPPRLAYTYLEAAESVGMSEGYIKQEIREGRLRKVKFGRAARVLASDLEAWAARKIVGSTAVQGESPAKQGDLQVIEKSVSAR